MVNFTHTCTQHITYTLTQSHINISIHTQTLGLMAPVRPTGLWAPFPRAGLMSTWYGVHACLVPAMPHSQGVHYVTRPGPVVGVSGEPTAPLPQRRAQSQTPLRGQTEGVSSSSAHQPCGPAPTLAKKAISLCPQSPLLGHMQSGGVPEHPDTKGIWLGDPKLQTE